VKDIVGMRIVTRYFCLSFFIGSGGFGDALEQYTLVEYGV
jgi:hypothetical protein